MSFLKITTTATLALAMSIGTALAAYPEKPVKIIVGFSAGGGTDTNDTGNTNNTDTTKATMNTRTYSK